MSGAVFEAAESNSLAPNDKHHVTLSGAASEAAESKGPHRLSGAPLARNGSVLWGDSSTHSRTRSLRMTWFEGVVIPCVGAVPRRGGAQVDMEIGASETHTSGSDSPLTIMATLLHGLTRSMPQLPMPDAEPEWLVTSS